MEDTFKPGEKVKTSGIYRQYDKDGKHVEQATCTKGEPFPPTLTEGNYWRLHVATDEDLT